MTQKIHINGTRFLNIDNIIYPSVSNIANAFSPKLTAKRPTQKLAPSGTAQATQAENTHRGIKLHQLLADGTTDYPDANLQMYLKYAKDFEAKHLTVHERETQVVFYDEGSGLRFAGAMDVLCDFRHKLCVADYKVSVRPKQLQHCFSFFLQIAGYAVAYEKANTIAIPTGTIINIHKYGVKTFHLSTVNFAYFKQSFIDAAIAYLRYQDALIQHGNANSRDYFDWEAYVENSPLHVAL
jgi:hypothetical protein